MGSTPFTSPHVYAWANTLEAHGLVDIFKARVAMTYVVINIVIVIENLDTAPSIVF